MVHLFNKGWAEIGEGVEVKLNLNNSPCFYEGW